MEKDFFAVIRCESNAEIQQILEWAACNKYLWGGGNEPLDKPGECCVPSEDADPVCLELDGRNGRNRIFYGDEEDFDISFLDEWEQYEKDAVERGLWLCTVKEFFDYVEETSVESIEISVTGLTVEDFFNYGNNGPLEVTVTSFEELL